MKALINKIDWNKCNDLVPCIIQNNSTKDVLMMGYMNEKALQKTIETKFVTFYSRTKERLWTKGEESGHKLSLIDLKLDCDNDTLLVLVNPSGPTCHLGTDTCWGNTSSESDFLTKLEKTIQKRKTADPASSYTAALFAKGINKVSQKVGEEAVELVIEAMDNNDKLFLEEASDLLYHYIVLLVAKGYELNDVVDVLKSRQ